MPNTSTAAHTSSPGRWLRLVLLLVGGLFAVYRSEDAGLTRIAELAAADAARPGLVTQATPRP